MIYKDNIMYKQLFLQIGLDRELIFERIMIKSLKACRIEADISLWSKRAGRINLAIISTLDIFFLDFFCRDR
ncbi:hypothetical protein BH20BAC1_BH20BAC1_06290 [soil metagenome]